MSFRPPYYGGFPGPPESQQRGQTSQRLERGFFPQQTFMRNDVTYYTDPANSGFPPASSSSLSYNSPPYIPANYFYNSPPPFFTNSSDPAASFNLGPHVNYPQSPPLLQAEVPQASFISSSPQPTESEPTRPPSSSDATSKSRRFSRQRTVKDAGASGEVFSNFNPSEHDERNQKQAGKHSIRFSHQREKKEGDQMHPGRSDPVLVKQSKGEYSTKVNQANQKSARTSKPHKPKSSATKNKKIPLQEQNQTGVLLEQLSSGAYECMVCCDRVQPRHAVWNCSKCYNLFHMGCIKKWARSPAAKIENSGWRCPGCQNVTSKVPASYYCFCGKLRDPEFVRGETAHSCGDVCGRKRKDNEGCTHPCNILCHPGPCPQCPAMVTKRCKCRKVSSRIRCSQQKDFMCDKPCGKTINCRRHKCQVVCHSGNCDDCEITVKQSCFCGGNSREVICGSEDHMTSTEGKYSCGNVCKKTLSCGNHTCDAVCHQGACKSCPFLPSEVKNCPCTQTKLADLRDENGLPVERQSCLDAVPTCDKICGKPLECGGDDVHLCKLPCHAGKCPPCADGESSVTCKCGKSEKDISCSKFASMNGYTCERRCNKKRKCGRHKCGRMCCVDTEHPCVQICGKRLTCGIHRCDELCHRGNCHVCYDVSFDELRCYCGEQVIFPPIPCGAKAPECPNVCSRMHPCTHPVRHTCHTDTTCPPCMELVKKPCNCGRVMRGNIMCHVTNVSCGTICNKTLQCGHKCPKLCHKGPCNQGEVCKQPCSIMKVGCIHPCAAPCHMDSPCPDTPCKAMVTLKCPCGRREDHVECSEGGALVQSVNSAVSSSKDSVDIGSLLRPGTANLRTLRCDEECHVYARNKRLAEALQIDTDEFGSENKQKYSEFLRNAAKADRAFLLSVEKELVNLVESVNWMGVAKQSHSFPPMKREKRQIIHELAEAFKCSSESHDNEPRRNVLVTADKSVSKQPTPLLSDVVAQASAVERTSSPARPAKKGLLRSMKLVSYSSSVGQNEGKSQTSSLRHHDNTIPASSRSTNTLSVSAIRPKIEALVLSSSTKRNDRVSATPAESPQNSRRPQSSPKPPSPPKRENIDYFDMTD